MMKSSASKRMTKPQRWLIAAALCCLGAAYRLPPAAHKFHASIAQIEYHAKEQKVALVIRFFLDDFETAISQHSKRPFKLATPQDFKDKAKGDAVLAYVRERFELKSKSGQPVKLNWVGMEAQADMVWVYLEGKLANGFAGAQLRSRVLTELFDDQVNIVNCKYDGKQWGTMFNAQDGFKAAPEKK
jgi:hypothetical protein